MYLTYGNYTFPSGECRIVINKQARYSPRGTLDVTVETWTVSGTIIASTQADIRTAINSLQSALSTNNQNVVFYHDDGTMSSHALLMSQAAGGIRVTGLSFPEWKGGQYATGRTYQFTVEAQYPNTAPEILSYQETLQFIGSGGPRYAYLELINGSPQRQQVSSQTLFRATQSGNAIGKGAYPIFPAPLWPQLEDGEARVRSLTGGEYIGGVLTNFGIQWGYSFTSDVPLFGLPTIY